MVLKSFLQTGCRAEPKNIFLSLFLVVIVVAVWGGLRGFVLNCQ